MAKISYSYQTQLRSSMNASFNTFNQNLHRIIQFEENTAANVITSNAVVSADNCFEGQHIQCEWTKEGAVDFIQQWNQDTAASIILVDYYDVMNDGEMNQLFEDVIPQLLVQGCVSENTTIYAPNDSSLLHCLETKADHLYQVLPIKEEFNLLWIASSKVDVANNTTQTDTARRDGDGIPFLQITFKPNAIDTIHAEEMKIENQLMMENEEQFNPESHCLPVPDMSKRGAKRQLSFINSSRRRKRARQVNHFKSDWHCCVHKKCSRNAYFTQVRLAALRISFNKMTPVDQRFFHSSKLSMHRTVSHNSLSRASSTTSESKQQEGDRSKLLSQFRIDNITVCNKFYKYVFQVSNNAIHPPAVKTKGAGAACPFKVSASRKTESILVWLDEFAKSQEIIPNASKAMTQFNVSDHNQVFNIYVTDSAVDQVDKASKSFFMQVWRTHRAQFKIRKHLAFAKCSTCETIRTNWTQTRDHVLLKEIELQMRQHVIHVQSERIYYRAKRQHAQTFKEQCISLIVDGTDQGSWGTPYFRQPTKDTASFWKLKTHITGVMAHGHGSFIYTCQFNVHHGTNLNIEVINRTLLKLEEKYMEQNQQLPPRLFIQLDNTCKENRNKILFSYFDMLIRRGIFREIYISFLPVGHTHEVSVSPYLFVCAFDKC